MVDIEEKQVNGHPRTSPVRGLVGQAAEVTGDVIELAELQFQLAKADAAAAIRIAMRPILFAGLGGVLMLASLPILLFATAGLIARYTVMPVEFAQLIVGLVVVVIAMTTAYVAMQSLKSSMTPFSRSAEEFKQNISWLKSIFRSNNN